MDFIRCAISDGQGEGEYIANVINYYDMSLSFFVRLDSIRFRRPPDQNRPQVPGLLLANVRGYSQEYGDMLYVEIIQLRSNQDKKLKSSVLYSLSYMPFRTDSVLVNFSEDNILQEIMSLP